MPSSKTGGDPVDEGAPSREDVVEVPALMPDAEYDAEVPLSEREKKWGFSLDELRGAGKVVRTLFLNPTLFVGDPYLSDSRLYTMITRDRQKKREYRDTYRVIMNEEKSRRKKYMRTQNQAALRLTIMKREREDALGALMLHDGGGSATRLLKEKPVCTAAEDAWGESEDVAARRGEGRDEEEDGLTARERTHLRLIGAVENVLRLERCLAGTESFTSTYRDARTIAQEAEGRAREAAATGADVPGLVGTAGTHSACPGPVDWAAASQLTAQVFRYVPHVFGSQMPPPLFAGAVPPDTGGRERLHFIRGLKIHLARQVCELCCSPASKETSAEVEGGSGGGGGDGAKRPKRELPPTSDGHETRSTPVAVFGNVPDALDSLAASNWDVAVALAPGSAEAAAADFTNVHVLRRWISRESGAAKPNAAATVMPNGKDDAATYRHVRTEALLDALERTLLPGPNGTNGGGVVDASIFSVPVTTGEAGEEEVDVEEALPAPDRETLERSAECSLNLLLARHLYGNQKLRDLGESPVVVERVPPTSTSEEPEEWNVFDDLQLYATEHYDGDGLTLTNLRSCNVCKIQFNRLHPFYYSMCHLCGEFNYNKRNLTRDLRGKVVLLTGCRIKIGFAMALSLLRCGATVLGTTRFAHEAVARFQQESDYAVWRDRLHLYSLDLRDLWVVTQFCAFVRQRFPKLFGIINNAAQTIARTPQYTEHLRHIEMNPGPALRTAIGADATAAEWHQFFLRHTTVTVGQPLSIEKQPTTHQPFLPAMVGEEAREGSLGRADAVGSGGVDDEAEVSAVAATRGPPSVTGKPPTGIVDRVVSAADGATTLVFDRYDTQSEESDHRVTNSWVMKLGEVQGSEAAEVMAINALSPFIINSKLKPCLMNRKGDATPNEARFIINVSAMEGQFYRFKQTTHPHTNMAKAALNMMTRTSAEDYAQDGIYMNSVDTGWITDESPKMKKERRAEQCLLCPLDEVDAAARCLDLMYTDNPIYGHFYKDFKSIPW